LKITLLGTGSITPTAKRFASSILVQTKSLNLLLDIGPGTIEKLRRLNISIKKINAFLITHFHIDHVADLLPLIMLWAYDEDGNPLPHPDKLNIIGPKGLKLLLKRLTEDVDEFSYLSQMMMCWRYLSVTEAGHGNVLDVAGVKVLVADVEHFNGVAFRLKTSEGDIVYSGDTVYDERLVELAKGCDVLIHECSFPEENMLGKHTSEKGLQKVVSAARPRIVVATHLYPIWNQQHQRIVEALKGLVEKVVVAEDFTVIEI